MNTIRKALDARWFLLVITIFLCAMVAAMYAMRSGLGGAFSGADLQQAVSGGEKIRRLVPGALGESMAKALTANAESQLAWAAFASETRRMLSCLAFWGLLGCVINLSPSMRRRVLGAGQPRPEPDPSA